MPKTLFTLPKRLNPLYHLRVSRINERIKKIIAPIIRSRVIAGSDFDHDDGPTNRTVLDLLAKAWQTQKPGQGRKSPEKVIHEYLQNVKIFMLAGLDTTSAAICYSIYLLSRNPRVLEQLREEHNAVFGTDSKATGDIIRESSEKLNALPFTLAVIKEALRLCPIALTVRRGNSSFHLVADGAQLPTQGFDIATAVWNIHHDSEYWPDVDETVPERWLVGKDDPLYPVKNAWRPFEHGSMNCIGQELAMLIIKLALVFVVREFDVECAWEAWDKAK